MSIPPSRTDPNRRDCNVSQQNSSPASAHAARVAEYRRLYQSFHINRRVSMGTSQTSGLVRWPQSEGNVSSEDPGMVLYRRARMLQGANLEATKNEMDWLRARVGAFSNVNNSRSRRARAAMIHVGTVWWNKCHRVYDANPESTRTTPTELQQDMNTIWVELYNVAVDVIWLEQMFKSP